MLIYFQLLIISLQAETIATLGCIRIKKAHAFFFRIIFLLSPTNNPGLQSQEKYI